MIPNYELDVWGNILSNRLLFLIIIDEKICDKELESLTHCMTTSSFSFIESLLNNTEMGYFYKLRCNSDTMFDLIRQVRKHLFGLQLLRVDGEDRVTLIDKFAP